MQRETTEAEGERWGPALSRGKKQIFCEREGDVGKGGIFVVHRRTEKPVQHCRFNVRRKKNPWVKKKPRGKKKPSNANEGEGGRNHKTGGSALRTWGDKPA